MQAADYKTKLDEIANVHMAPDPAQEVDALCQRLDRDKMLSWLEGPNVLEMGVGDGVWTEAVLERFGKTHVVDASGALLASWKERHGDQVLAYEEYFEQFEPPEGLRFQTVLATHILEHVDDPCAVLRQMRGWLAPGGKAIVIVPNATSLHRRIGVKLGILETVYQLSERDHVVGHQRVYDLPTLRSDIEQSGFEVVHERGFMVKVLSNGQMADFSPELISAFVDISDDLPAELSCNLGVVIAPRAS